MSWKYRTMSTPDAYISKENADKIIAIARSQRDVLLFHILSRTGRRVTEVLMLRVSDINFESETIKWNILKKRKEHIIDLPVEKQTFKLLRDWIENKDLAGREFIFKGRGKAGHLTSRRVRYILVSYGKKLGISQLGGYNIHPHMFRHGFAIHFVRSMKKPDHIFHLQKLLQHADIRETMWYVDHFGRTETREVLEKMWS